MALNIQEILGSTTIPAMKDIINNNNTELEGVINNFLLVYNSVTGNMDLSSQTNGILTAKQVIVPLGTSGIDVGNTQIRDTSVTAATLNIGAVVNTVTSINFVNYSVNQIASGVGNIPIDDNISTVILDPTLISLEVEIASPSGDIMKEIDVVNLSTAGHPTILRATTNFLDSATITTITIPSKKNVRLKYINDGNTSTQGWYVVSHNGCTIA